jgi:hypothetical protein
MQPPSEGKTAQLERHDPRWVPLFQGEHDAIDLANPHPVPIHELFVEKVSRKMHQIRSSTDERERDRHNRQDKS